MKISLVRIKRKKREDRVQVSEEGEDGVQARKRQGRMERERRPS